MNDNSVSITPRTAPSPALGRRIAILSVLALWAVAARSQSIPPSAPPDTARVGDVARRAARASPDVAVARAAVELGLAGVLDARRRTLPSLDLSVDASQRYGLSFDETTGQLVRASTQRLGLGSSAQFTVYQGGRVRAELGRQRAELRVLEAAVVRKAQGAAAQAVEAYLRVLLGRSAAAVQADALADETDLLNRVRLLASSGIRPPSDLFQQQAAVAARERALVGARRSETLATAALAGLLGLDPLSPIVVEAPAVADTVALLNPPSARDLYRDLVDRALRAHPDLGGLRASVEAGEIAVRAALAERLPTVALFASAGSNFTSAADPGFGAQALDNRTAVVGVAVTVPVSPWLYGDPAAGARAALSGTRAALDGTRARVEADLAREVITYVSGAEEARVALVQRAAARRALDAVLLQYVSGDGSYVELDRVRNDYVTAEAAVASAVAETYFARTLLDYYTGTLDYASTPPARGAGGAEGP